MGLCSLESLLPAQKHYVVLINILEMNCYLQLHGYLITEKHKVKHILEVFSHWMGE